jgi:uncharacterized protein (UPF0335 family)
MPRQAEVHGSTFSVSAVRIGAWYDSDMDTADGQKEDVTLKNLVERIRLCDVEQRAHAEKVKDLYANGAAHALHIDAEVFARKCRGHEKELVDTLLQLIQEYSSTARRLLDEVIGHLDPESHVTHEGGVRTDLYRYVLTATKARGWSIYHMLIRTKTLQ